MPEKHLIAVRGAVQCKNEARDMAVQVGALYDEILTRNKLAEEDLVSLIFSVTADLDEANPATALRTSGRAANVALFVTQEARVKNGAGSTDHIVRLLIHAYGDPE
ncbi:MAG: chorismate mutase, partial [Spirochaetaceae bacterium]|nr:chorismate mutase [Spirochaetaceae bacterium]